MAVADGKGDAVGVMEAPHPDTGKLRARSLQAVNLGNTVRHGPRASNRAAGECLISVRRLEPFPATHIDGDRVIGDQQVRHETTFWRAPAAGGQGSCCRSAIDPRLVPTMACPYVAGWRGAVTVVRQAGRGA